MAPFLDLELRLLDLPLLDLHHLLMKLKWSLKRTKGKRMKGKMPTAEGEGYPGKLRYK